VSLKNWDNKTWLSSKKYIQSFLIFLLRQIELKKDSRILDVGCGRGKIIGTLFSKLRLRYRPIGIDLERHKDRDKRFYFKRIHAISYLKQNKKKYDLILIKQTIHFLNFNEIRKLLFLCKKSLKDGGKILIFTLETSKNEIPTFSLMKKKLQFSLNRDKKIIRFISKLYPKIKKKKFLFKVKIFRHEYIKMIKNRFISTLLDLNSNEILKGVDEIQIKYKKMLSFNDKLTCIIIDK
tara:strand:+ start:563 stop:1270 length:708 start_codon:yes stop_codon:yes gene_type:complete